MFPLRDDNPKNRPAIVMWFFVGLNIIIFAYSFWLVPEITTINLINDYGFCTQIFL